VPIFSGERSSQPGKQRHVPDWIDRRPKRRKILADLDQKRRHMSERVFYPDTDDGSSTSKVVALSIARNRTRELILSASTIRFAPDESAVADALTIHPIKLRGWCEWSRGIGDIEGKVARVATSERG